ncbi:MAG: YIP1 family protein [Steroidobacteraceae bacterium]
MMTSKKDGATLSGLPLAGMIFTDPATAFAELRQRPRFWLPLLLIALSSAAVTFWYFKMVDYEWFKDFTINSNPLLRNIDEAGRARVAASMGKAPSMWNSLLAVPITLSVMFALQALYYFLAGKVTKLGESYKTWFALMTWSSLPALIGLLIVAVLLASKGLGLQMGYEQLQALSINELILHREPGSPGYGLVSSIGVLSVWVWWLRVIAVRTWSNRSWLFSSLFVLLPVAIFYGGWAAWAFR